MSAYHTIEITLQNHIGTIRLNLPDIMNAYTDDMGLELIQAFNEMNQHEDVRVIILTGAGDDFCAGAYVPFFAELHQKLKTGVVKPESYQYVAGDLVKTMLKCRKPIIAALHGAAVGVGSTMILAADIRLCTTDTKLGYIFTQRAIVPEACSSLLLPLVVGQSKASEWCMTGRYIDAEEAHNAGLINHVVDDAYTEAFKIAESIIQTTAPIAVAQTRKLLWQAAGGMALDQAYNNEKNALMERLQSNDMTEAVTAFMQKRPPVYQTDVSCVE